MANTVNAALKPLETLSRIVNQPSSLFGGKGGSSKNKTEHDTVGTVRNSNTQDQGNAHIIDHFNSQQSMDTLSLLSVVLHLILCTGEAGEAEPAENRDRGQATDADLMDGETEGDTVVIAGQPEVLSTQAMQVRSTAVCGTVLC